MNPTGQQLTRSVYEDPAVVAAFSSYRRTSTARHDDFSASLPGRRIIDIGCGAGVDSRYFAQPGWRVTGVDYSKAMIREARANAGGEDGPQFFELDMRAVGQSFPEGSFDGAWLSASFLHIPEAEALTVLFGIYRILASGGRIGMSLKAGAQGASVINEFKHGRDMVREFTFWEQPRFEDVLCEAGFDEIVCVHDTGGFTGGSPTQWLYFTATVRK